MLRDWVAPLQALAALQLTENATLEVWPAGLLRFVAATEHAVFIVWVPLTTPHGRNRSRDLLRVMRLAPSPASSTDIPGEEGEPA